METKTCTKCKIEKPLSEYYTDNRYEETKYKPACKICHNKVSKKNYEDNFEKRSMQIKLWGAKNPLKIKEIKRNFKKKHPKYYATSSRKWMENPLNKKKKYDYFKTKRVKNKISIRDSINRENLSDTYIKQQLQCRGGLKCENITEELIEIKRLQITLKREIKNEKSKTNENN